MDLIEILSRINERITDRGFEQKTDILEIISGDKPQLVVTHYLDELLLAPGQRIVYSKNNNYYSQVDHNKKLPLPVAQYLRYYQPFVKTGEQLDIVLGNVMVRTSVITRAYRLGNRNFFQTKDGLYQVKYEGIDLGKVLCEDRNHSNDRIKQFPKAV
ncbi:hypothetical protein HZA96_05840 [Candidatus Woesearchaeota archaeon]|nr:hypothetical protein [Candidatus Woesearchaeota archaeon]